MKKRVSVAVSDLQPLFAQGVASTFSQQKHIDFFGSVVGFDAISTLCDERRAHVLVIDSRIYQKFLDTRPQRATTQNQVKMIVTSEESRAEFVSATLSTGAHGYFLKSESCQSLVHAVQSVMNGDVYVTPKLAASLFQSMKEQEPCKVQVSLRSLTRRETEILYCVGLGLSNKQIARKLTLSEKTVKHYLTGIFQKLSVQNRVQAALIAQRATPDFQTAAAVMQ